MLVRLLDGTRVVIRPIRPSDKDALAAGLGRLSAGSAYARFLTAKAELSPRELRYLTEVDGERHVAFVAMLVDDPGHLVGVGRYVRDPEDPRTAEVAVTVGDSLHGQGLGSRLGLALADHARAHGIRRFSATMLTDNAAAHRLFARISERLESTSAAGVDELLADLAA